MSDTIAFLFPTAASRRVGTAFLLGCTALCAAPATAQDAQGQRVTALAPIVVEGQDDTTTVVAEGLSFGGKVGTDILDTAGSISVVTAKELQQRGVQSAEQALQYTAGIVTDFYGTDNRWDFFKIRGFDAYTYRDGLRLGGSGQSSNNLREEIYAYERVEVLKGADTTLFGVSDPGGMVNYVTKTPKTERFGEAYATVGSFAHAETGVDFGDNLTPDGSLSYRITAKVQDAESDEDYSRDDGNFLMGGLTWRPSDATTVTVVADYLKTEGSTSSGLPFGAGLDRDTFLGEPDFNFVGNERTALSLMVDHDFGGGLSFSGNTRYDDSSSDFGMVFLGSTIPDTTTVNRAFFANDTKGHRFNSDARLTYDTAFGSVESSTSVGAQYVSTGYTRLGWYLFDPAAGGPAPIDWDNPIYSGAPVLTAGNAYENIQRSEDTRALYVQQRFTFSERLIATIGLRHDWTDIEQTNRMDDTVSENELSETTARVGLTYKITPEVSAYATYAESAVPASTLTLDPELGKQYELGVKYRPEAMNALFSAAIYDLTKENISRTNLDNNQQYLVGEIRARGLELEARAEVLDGLEMIAAYSYTDTEVTDSLSPNQGNELDKVPNHLASLWTNYTLQGNGARGEMTFGIGARYTGTYFNDAANANGRNESAMIYDAAVSYEIAADTAVSVNVTNLFDKEYDTGGSAIYYNPGREIRATLRRNW